MIETLERIDHAIFLAINGAHNSLLDSIMIWVANRKNWIFYYLILAWFIFRKYKLRGIVIILFAALCVTATDQISTHLFKNVFMRYRPCHNEELKPLIYLADARCGGMYGFVSSHAANTAGLAVFLISCGFARFRSASVPQVFAGWTLLVYVILNCYCRVYLAAHYPSDVIGGIILGFLTGLALGWIVHRKFLLKS